MKWLQALRKPRAVPHYSQVEAGGVAVIPNDDLNVMVDRASDIAVRVHDALIAAGFSEYEIATAAAFETGSNIVYAHSIGQPIPNWELVADGMRNIFVSAIIGGDREEQRKAGLR